MPVSDRDRALLRAVDLIDRTTDSCGHSTLVTTRVEDMGHFHGESSYCEACSALAKFERSQGEDKIGGRKHHVVDRRLAGN